MSYMMYDYIYFVSAILYSPDTVNKVYMYYINLKLKVTYITRDTPLYIHGKDIFIIKMTMLSSTIADN